MNPEKGKQIKFDQQNTKNEKSDNFPWGKQKNEKRNSVS
jgi:hypothetical protein